MKKKVLLAITALLVGVLSTAAQTTPALLLYRGPVVVSLPASAAGIMTYGQGAEGRLLSIGGTTYVTADIDSIVVAPQTAPAAEKTVQVTYTGTTARVIISGDVAPYVTAQVDGAHVMLTAAPDVADEITYSLSGQSTNGSFTLNGSYKCTVALDGLELTSGRGAAIDIRNGKRINIDVKDRNVLNDFADGIQKACFVVKGHAEFRGSGTLELTGNKAHAYSSGEYTSLKDEFSGQISIKKAANDGMHIGQYYEQKNGTVNITGCTGDGIDCDSTKDVTDELNGQVLICGGTIGIVLGASDDVKGIKSADTLTVSGGAITITGSGDGQKGMKAGTSLLVNDAVSAPLIDIALSGTTYHKGLPDESKTRGIKVDKNFTLDGGILRISTTGAKGKPVVVEGIFYYKKGSYNCAINAAAIVE